MAAPITTEQVLEYVTDVISSDPAEETVLPQLVTSLITEIIKRMTQECFFFSLVYTAVYLVGSYRERVKISKPDEFTFNVLMKFPKAVMVQDAEEMGTLRIDMTAYKNGEEKYSFIRRCLDSENFLYVACIHSYFESLLRRIRILKEPIYVNGRMFYLTLQNSGSAYKIKVHTAARKPINPFQEFESSLELVPAIVFKYGDVNEETIALPKQIKRAGSAQLIHFTPAFPRQEENLMKDKQHMKIVLRLVKKIRNRFLMKYLKSYFVKTILLWIHQEKGAKYWDKSTAVLLEETLKKILQYLEERNLPYFWRPKYNMLKQLTTSQIDKMRYHMGTVVKRFQKDRNSMRFVKLFFNQNEMVALLFNPPKRGLCEEHVAKDEFTLEELHDEL